MKKLIYLMAIMATSLTTFAQSDSTVVADTATSEFEVYAGGVIASRNYARGVNFGSGLSIQPYAGMTYKGVTLEFFAAITADGTYDYGTTRDFSLSYENSGFKVGLHDYYFFSKYGNHNYLFETASDTMNGHYYEVQVSYEYKKLSLLAGHNFYNTNLEVTGDYWKGVYLEGNYSVNDNLSIVIGGLTGPSIVNFYDAAGITTIGLDWSRDIKISEDLETTLDAKFHVNPNYKNISPGVQQAPMNFFVSLTF